MIVNGAVCKKCHTFVFSRSRHDYRSCPCKTIAVDGGSEYLKISGESPNYYLAHYDIPADIRTLYLDWTSERDEFGWLPEMIVTKGVGEGFK